MSKQAQAEQHPMKHTWEEIDGAPSRSAYLRLKGHKDAIVRIERLPQGYLWQYDKKYGFAESLEKAKDWVETLAEHYSIPTKDRWLHII